MPVNISFTTEQLCSICLEAYNESTGHDAVRLGCQHAFGRKCVQAWASQSTTCPACRSNFLPESLRADESIPQSLADRLVVTLREQRSALYVGLIFSLIAVPYIILIFAPPVELLALSYMAISGFLAFRMYLEPA